MKTRTKKTVWLCKNCIFLKIGEKPKKNAFSNQSSQSILLESLENCAFTPTYFTFMFSNSWAIFRMNIEQVIIFILLCSCVYRKYITYAEVQCKGPGANLSKRVKWEKTLSSGELQKFIDRKLFLNQDNWIEEQLKHV